jgi:Zn finger protein HypA/HybF involved in hydrogenase expression
VNRQQRRAMKKQLGEKAQVKMSNQVSLFGKLPQSCSACDKEFDKKNKEMVQSWSVLVKQEVVRLFCPDCIGKTREVIDECEKTIADITEKDT